MAFRKIRQIRIEGNVAFVPLTKGYEAVIDANDVHLVDGHNWYALVDRRKDGSIRSVYAQRMSQRNDGKQVAIQMHRAINGTPADMDTDHVSTDGLDNRRANLRTATKAQNAQNRRTRTDNVSGAKGVTWDAKAGKWLARISMNGARITIGRFTTVEDAAAEYERHSALLHGEFGRLA